MKKYYFLFFFYILFSSICFGQNNIGIIKQTANVRWEPSVKSGIIKQFSKGKVVVILEKKGRWSLIENPIDNRKGWVSNSLILKAGVLKSDANVRWEPSIKSGIIKQFSKGKAVVILEKKGRWSLIENPIDNRKGWMSNSVLSLSLNSTQKTKPVVVLEAKNIPPNCDYTIISPSNKEKNVDINPTIIKWKHGSGSPKGYYFSIATKNEGNYNYIITKENKKLKKVKIGNVNSYSVLDLKPNTEYFIGLIPYNDIGLGDCDGMFSFTTGNSSTSINTITSSEQIIKNRLSKMGIKWKWDSFKKTNLKSISMNNSQRKNFTDEVLSWKGVPYKYGGKTRAGIDCSGLIWRGLRQAIDFNGEKLNAQGWAQSGKLLANKKELIKGDLVCFSNIPGGSSRLVQHIAIYIGNGKFWHAPSKGKRVSEADLNNTYWKNKFIFGVRY